MKFRNPIFLLLLTVLLFAACGKKVQVGNYSIIPEPVELVEEDGSYTITPRSRLCFVNLAQNSPTVKYITQSLRKMHVHPAFIGTPKKDCITFTLLDSLESTLGPEGYRLSVVPEGVFVYAATEAGLFYGYQTFLQMLPPDVATILYSRVVLPGCTITDYPRFSWRGSHLDVSRHFFTVQDIKKHLDLMAMYKLNRFHWHLTDDQGWRIEIDGYTQLNDVGSWRVDRTDVPWGTEKPAEIGEEPTYGGFYSKEDVADIIAYAAERHIEVIPEIELPGHSSAVLAAYPELGCPGTHYDVAIGEFWPTKAILCAGNDRSVDFLFGVLDEVMQMFPSDYIHIGGDEVFPDNWEHCPKCQARMRELHLEKVSQLQGWFIDTVASYLSRKGKRIVGWDEMLDCGTSAKDAVVMSWRSTEAARRAVRLGYEAVLAPTEFCYLDYYQADPKTQPLAFNGYISLVKAYSFDPMPANLTPDEQRLVLGGQANLWTEYINNYEHAEYMLLPRLCALAECFWTPVENKDWPRFMMKTEHHRTILHAYGYNCCDIPSLHDQYDAEVNH